jgi:hypothetical protein
MDLLRVAQTPEGKWVPFEATITSITPNSILLMPPGFGFSTSWLRFRSGTRSQPVKQSGDRTFTLVFDSTAA